MELLKEMNKTQDVKDRAFKELSDLTTNLDLNTSSTFKNNSDLKMKKQILRPKSHYLIREKKFK